jgi:transcriptional regulator with XRE-family HTH domain
MAKASELLAQARRVADLTQEEVAVSAGTSRPTVCAYEAGAKEPRVDTMERLLGATGHRLAAVPRPRWQVVGHGRRSAYVPDRLPELPTSRAVAEVTLGDHLAWSGKRTFDLSDRRQRARAYEIVLREGSGDDIEAFVDGALLIDLWDELILPAWLRAGWRPAIDRALHG